MKFLFLTALVFGSAISAFAINDSQSAKCSGYVTTGLFIPSNEGPKTEFVQLEMGRINSSANLGDYGFTTQFLTFEKQQMKLEIRNAEGFTIAETVVSAKQLEVGVYIQLPLKNGNVGLSCSI